ncbi:MAG TPA: Ldh family oxidoreductase [Sinorhizobium sp.]|nr:Ldh family oxidoreductase [Sinorhizobium sp.]
MAVRTFPGDTIGRQLAAIFAAWGMPEAIARPTVEVMVETDLSGIDSHGIAMMPLYAEQRAEGRWVAAPEIRIVRETAVTGLIDGGNGLGHAPSVRAIGMAIEKAKTSGLAAIGVRNSNHYGAAGIYALRAAEQGLIGIATTNVWKASVVPTRSRRAMFGTNPIAFAAPAGRNPPFVLDMATSTVAIGKLTVAKLNLKPIPEGWAVDDTGRPTTDPVVALKHRLLSPLGGVPSMSSHKGYGLAAMVEILSAMLPGAFYAPTRERRHPGLRYYNVGHFFLAIDPGAFRDPAEFRAEIDDMIDALHGAEPVGKDLPVLVPGDPEHAARASRRVHGVPVPASLRLQIKNIADAAGVPFVLE